MVGITERLDGLDQDIDVLFPGGSASEAEQTG